MHLCDTPAMGRRQPNQQAENPWMIDSAKTSVAETAKLLRSVSFKTTGDLISQLAPKMPPLLRKFQVSRSTQIW
jgi:hypothetical protein